MNKNVLIRLRDNIPTLNQAEKAAARYVYAHPKEASACSVQKLASRSFVSPSAVVRMCKSLGFSGYKEFRQSLIQELAVQDETMVLSDYEIQREDSCADIIQKITMKNLQSLLETQRLMDAEVLEECVALMKRSQRILLFGLGASWIAARDAYLKFLRINKNCIINEDWHLQLLSARNSTEKDMAIMISYSGQTEEMIKCEEALKKNNTPVLAITRCVDSPISDMADLKLYTTANESLFRTGAMSSRISQLNIIDILYTAYANSEYDYCLEELRKTHIEKPQPKQMK